MIITFKFIWSETYFGRSLERSPSIDVPDNVLFHNRVGPRNYKLLLKYWNWIAGTLETEHKDNFLFSSFIRWFFVCLLWLSMLSENFILFQ